MAGVLGLAAERRGCHRTPSRNACKRSGGGVRGRFHAAERVAHAACGSVDSGRRSFWKRRARGRGRQVRLRYSHAGGNPGVLGARASRPLSSFPRKRESGCSGTQGLARRRPAATACRFRRDARVRQDAPFPDCRRAFGPLRRDARAPRKRPFTSGRDARAPRIGSHVCPDPGVWSRRPHDARIQSRTGAGHGPRAGREPAPPLPTGSSTYRPSPIEQPFPACVH